MKRKVKLTVLENNYDCHLLWARESIAAGCSIKFI